MNKKGQALVEFVIILPIFVFMLLGIIDFGIIIYNTNNLEGKMDSTVSLYKKNNNYKDVENYVKHDDKSIDLTITNENNKYLEFKLSKNIELITPGLGLIIGNPYKVTVKRTIYYE